MRSGVKGQRVAAEVTGPGIWGRGEEHGVVNNLYCYHLFFRRRERGFTTPAYPVLVSQREIAMHEIYNSMIVEPLGTHWQNAEHKIVYLTTVLYFTV